MGPYICTPIPTLQCSDKLLVTISRANFSPHTDSRVLVSALTQPVPDTGSVYWAVLESYAFYPPLNHESRSKASKPPFSVDHHGIEVSAHCPKPV